ncbi:MAG: phage head-tail connector protein [Hespellia sp.]|nr:phage head-tail connector protein [Hespellia sp.]
MLRDIKNLLGVDESDTSLDARLNWIMDSVRARLKLMLGGTEPPDEMNYIITEVSIIRFNRIGSEGVTSQTVEGESNSYQEDDFAGYKDEIQVFLENQKSSTKGKVRFL